MEDLTPYAEKSESVHLEDYYPKVLECGRKEGILVTIPKNFEIDTVITSKNYFGDVTWNYPQLLDFCNAHPNSLFYANISPDYYWQCFFEKALITSSARIRGNVILIQRNLGRFWNTREVIRRGAHEPLIR
ncbi:MAG: hypothetical protein IKO03_02575 [Lachnospiraceae bacterium]|nr:hypothetical protein [Lachnospiraceae bacterium]